MTRLSLLMLSVALGSVAHADVSISNKPTQNMSCSAGVCTAIAQKAVLNVGDVTNMLASGDLTIKTGGIAKDISIAQPLSWASTSRLTLDAQQSVIVKKPVTVMGTGNLTITTNDGGHHGEFIIVPERGSVQFWDLSSSLIIDDNSYTLVYDIKTLAADIAANPAGSYALAKPYDASVDGTYSATPIHTTLSGVIEGLSNDISNLTIKFAGNPSIGGLLSAVSATGTIRHVRLVDVVISGAVSNVGSLVAVNAGTLKRDAVTGRMNFENTGSQFVGGLAAGSTGKVEDSSAIMQMGLLKVAASKYGGLLGVNGGTISRCYADGAMSYQVANSNRVGGLIGENSGSVDNSYARNSTKNGRANNNNEFGGLVGQNDDGGTVTSSYAAGRYTNRHAFSNEVGGLIGEDDASAGSISSSYWDLDKGISDPSQGAGNIPNDPGITGLTDAQLKSELPDGFDPKIWGQAANINNGYPYLLANPPTK